ncbi:diaminopimelate epimerase [Nitzschia inconspicua]|uniref:diaminopimelate epimerase n=1 Tax=Nitzschia inconspicua TaxID=303405 RepID=A0A9K3Q3S5_9STRA|nr:diaminopimelate epimerase [Nitzschia inconspicua]KAG7370033.1 diaminopimelate epimerase [Nitzschia inconspicua]
MISRRSVRSVFLLLSIFGESSNAWMTSKIPQSTRRTVTALQAATVASPTLVEFSKYEGLGNDFILIDDRDRDTPSLTPEESEKLCDRNFGVGGDGVIFALKPPSEGDYDFRMRIYNSDGSEPEMCGNGIRCFAQFLKDLGADAESYKVDTLAGPIVPIMNADGTITVDMGPPILKAANVPTTLASNAEDDSVVEQTMECNGKTWKVNAVSMGNPHCIIFVDDLENDIDFERDGPALEACTEFFPAKTNVEFVQVMSDTHLKMKVWERGAGPTLACGTGACALTVAAIRAGKIPSGNKVRVTLPGGDLFIEWITGTDNKVFMTGPAVFSFQGKAALK